MRFEGVAQRDVGRKLEGGDVGEDGFMSDVGSRRSTSMTCDHLLPNRLWLVGGETAWAKVSNPTLAPDLAC